MANNTENRRWAEQPPNSYVVTTTGADGKLKYEYYSENDFELEERALKLLQEKDFEAALSIIEKLPVPGHRDHVLTSAVGYCIEAQALDTGFDIAQRITTVNFKNEAFSDLATESALVGKFDLANRAAAEIPNPALRKEKELFITERSND